MNGATPVKLMVNEASSPEHISSPPDTVAVGSGLTVIETLALSVHSFSSFTVTDTVVGFVESAPVGKVVLLPNAPPFHEYK